MTNYRVYGTTDEITVCQQCGKPELKGTVMLQILDADGNAEDMTYVGSHCAAKMTGAKAAGIKRAAETNDMVKSDALAWSRKTIDHLVERAGSDRPGKLFQAYADIQLENYPNLAHDEAWFRAVEAVLTHLKVIETEGASALSFS